MELVLTQSFSMLDYFNEENGGDVEALSTLNDHLQQLAVASGMSSPSMTYHPMTRTIDFGRELPHVDDLAYWLEWLFYAWAPFGGRFAVLDPSLLMAITTLYEEFYPKTNGLYEPGAAGIAPIPWLLGVDLMVGLGHIIEVKSYKLGSHKPQHVIVDFERYLAMRPSVTDQPTESSSRGSNLVDYTDTPPPM